MVNLLAQINKSIDNLGDKLNGRLETLKSDVDRDMAKVRKDTEDKTKSQDLKVIVDKFNDMKFVSDSKN